MNKNYKKVFGFIFLCILLNICLIRRAKAQDSGYIESIRMSPNGDIFSGIKSAIQDAQNTIDIAVYIFEYKPIADLLVKAQKRGVKVRVITDERSLAFSAKDDTEDYNFNLIPFLLKHGIDVRVYNPEKLGKNGIMHQKYIIIDNKKVYFGSYNFKVRAQLSNQENFVLINSRTLSSNFENNFNKIFKNFSNKFDTPSQANLAFLKEYYYQTIKWYLKYILILYASVVSIFLGFKIFWDKSMKKYVQQN
jgi:phosphatidylserine/phosphatidylglycerophosphate/cardiolipin synthase-like enzyme